MRTPGVAVGLGATDPCGHSSRHARVPATASETTGTNLRAALEQYIQRLREEAQTDALAGRLSPATVRQLVVRELAHILTECDS